MAKFAALKFCSVGVVILFVAFVLQFITSISLPALTTLNIVRVDFKNGTLPLVSEVQGQVESLRLGIWAYCTDTVGSGDRSCVHTGHAYSVAIQGASNSLSSVHASWTRGLAVHPVAAGVTFLAFLLSFSNHITVLLIASLTSFLAALITLIAFAIDIALLVLTKNNVDNLVRVQTSTNPGPGFWLTFVSFILLLISGCTVCFSRHRARRSQSGGASAFTQEKRPFWRRFRRN
ncbi:hypothetical protein M422DRAFT_212828 [Sphaerobolus stellatus SS14]|uniref:Pali-domain-containing protein n=1 Tax=Sphaerobolus stellatus (strain SS14) TaxID=990650 RepID=A0A0C9UJ88_SPHS4|nr:hypothetical protein M422DRAFT_212828 [Sphaerobolus stellatus SS14]